MIAFVAPSNLSILGACRLSTPRLCSRVTRKYISRVSASAEVSKDVVEKTARLAQLALSEDEAAKITPEFQKIIGFIDQMNQLDLEGVEPMTRPHEAYNVIREDTPALFSEVDEIMEAVPAVERDFVRVPKISSEGTT